MAIPFEDSINRTTNAPRWTDEKVANLAARDALSATLRYESMVVYVISEQKSYQLVGGILDANWKEFGAGSGVTNLLSDTFTATASQTVFTLTNDPITKNNIFCFIDGVPQNLSSFSLSGLDVTLSEGQPAGAIVEFRYGAVLSVGTPGDGTVTTPKIVDANVTTDKIANGAVTRSKLSSVGQQISSSSGTGGGSFSTSSTSYVDVTNLSVTISNPTGRPIFLGLICDQVATTSRVAGGGSYNVSFVGYSTRLTEHFASSALQLPPSAFWHIDAAPPTGSPITYKVQTKVGSSSVTFDGVKLITYELA